MRQERLHIWMFLLSSDSLTDLISSYYMISVITDKDTELLQEIQEQKQQIENR